MAKGIGSLWEASRCWAPSPRGQVWGYRRVLCAWHYQNHILVVGRFGGEVRWPWERLWERTRAFISSPASVWTRKDPPILSMVARIQAQTGLFESELGGCAR